jgi:hypothetical protein
MFKIKLFLFVLIFSFASFTVFAQTDDWRQYSSTIAGYAVNYPSDWRSEEKISKSVWHASFFSPGVRDDDIVETARITICSQPKAYISNSSDYWSKRGQLSEKTKITSETTIEINGIKIRKRIAENQDRLDSNYIHASFLTKDREILISSYFPKKFNLDKYIPVFDQMLSTLQIVGNDTKINYRNAKYRFSLSYSASWRSCPASGFNTKKEDILVLTPKDEGCQGANYISVSTMSDLLKNTKLVNVKEILRKQNYSEITPNFELSEIQTISGEKIEGKYIYRQRYFSTNEDETNNLLKISEMYNSEKEKPQQEAKEILATIKRF